MPFLWGVTIVNFGIFSYYPIFNILTVVMNIHCKFATICTCTYNVRAPAKEKRREEERRGEKGREEERRGEVIKTVFAIKVSQLSVHQELHVIGLDEPKAAGLRGRAADK